MSAVLGISFGNTSSSIAIASQDGKVEVIANPDGDRAIPSALSFLGEDEYFGAQATAQLIKNASNTIINFRDYIAKDFKEVSSAAVSNGAKLVEVDGNVGFEVVRGGKTEVISVFDASVSHLSSLRAAAEDFGGNKIEGVVIGVPSDFTAAQKTELEKISEKAGMKVLQLVNETSAALIAHLAAQEAENQADKVYVVADFGGIRSDAAVIAVRGGILTVLATTSKKGLGGESLDDALAEYLAKEFEKKNKSDPRKTARSLAKLKAESALVKRTLSNVQTSTCSIESLADGFDFHTSINRLRFELTGRHVFTDMTRFVEEAIAKAALENLDIDAVLLVGGTSHIPKLATNLTAIFPESTQIIASSLDPKTIDPSEAVARGAALHASMIQGFEVNEIKDSLSSDIVDTKHLVKPIGIKDAAGAFHTILHAQTAYPIKKSIEVSNGESTGVEVSLYEGKRTIKENVLEPEKYSDEEDEDLSEEEPEIVKELVYVPGDLLAELSLKDLQPSSKLEITVNVTKDGVLHFSGRELKQGSVSVKADVSIA